ncbi:MAG: PqqD family protein [Bacteroidota bacterium]|nr:PqqD family protein [Bacteroidota bacterium]
MKIDKNIAISDNGLLFNPATGESFSVNIIGTKIVKLMQEDRSISEISKAITNEFDVDNDTIEKDILDFGYLLKNHHLVQKDG